MTGTSPSTSAGDAWRDHVLREVVAHLEADRDAIIERFEATNEYGLGPNSLKRADCSISM